MDELNNISLHRVETFDELTYKSAINDTRKEPVLHSLCIYEQTPESEMSIVKALKFYVFPALFCVGLTANIMSIAILKRSGLRKPTNILLLGVVIADCMVQLQVVNFAEVLAVLGPNYKYPELCGWQYGEEINFILLASDILFYFFGEYGVRVNTTIPILITLERFLAVYMPMTFKKIVTTKSALVCVIAAYVIWLPWVVFFLSLHRYTVQLSRVMIFGIWFSRENMFDLFALLNYNVIPFISTWMPIFFIGIGSVLISIKVKMSLNQRKRLMSTQVKMVWSSRTTRTLLITCLVLFVSTIISFFLAFFNTSIPEGYYYLEQDCVTLNYVLNASSSFFVYIATNKKLASIFRDIVGRNGNREVQTFSGPR
uniref:G-protein coupled receptors family 1 profile domain-containing protein n=1 Tax=Biomphalaria glabrata TaxID=6526 RepID=A0A2C9LNY9_BIOGL